MVRARARIDIVKWLLEHPDSLVSDVVQAIGSQRITTRQHLVALEDIGVVQIDLPEGERERRQVRYRVDRGRVTALLRALADYIAIV